MKSLNLYTLLINDFLLHQQVFNIYSKVMTLEIDSPLMEKNSEALTQFRLFQ